MKARVERKARPSTSLPAIKRPGRAPGTWLLFLRYLRVVHELRSLLFYILRLYFIRSHPRSSASSSSHSLSLSLPSLSFSLCLPFFLLSLYLFLLLYFALSRIPSLTHGTSKLNRNATRVLTFYSPGTIDRYRYGEYIIARAATGSRSSYG